MTQQTVHALRGFALDELGRLRGMSHPAVFKPGVNTAECKLCGTEKLRDCVCGFWAYFSDKNPQGEPRPEVYRADIAAVIAGSGNILVAEHGVRAQRARAVALFPAPRALRPTAYLYPHVGRLRALFRRVSPAAVHILGVLVASAVMLSAVILQVRDVVSVPVVLLIVAAGVWLYGLAGLASRVDNTDDVEAALKSLTRPDPGKEWDTLHRLERLYPGVPVYPSMREALRQHPLSRAQDLLPPPAPVPTPETDPTFWERP
jgi:hypothetical protein